MPALKDCLRNFGKASSRLAFPSAQRTVVIETVGPSTVEGTHQYIAPADGYVTVWAEGSASVTVELRIDYSLQQLSSNAAASWGKRRYLVPVARSFTTHFGGRVQARGGLLRSFSR